MSGQKFIPVKLKRLKNHFQKGGTVNDDLTAIINVKVPKLIQGYVEQARKELEDSGVGLKKKQFKLIEGGEDEAPEVEEETINDSSDSEGVEEEDEEPSKKSKKKKDKKSKKKKDKKSKKKSKETDSEETPEEVVEEDPTPLEESPTPPKYLLLKEDGSASELMVKKQKGNSIVLIEASERVVRVNLGGELVDINVSEVMAATENTLTIGGKSYPVVGLQAAITLAL